MKHESKRGHRTEPRGLPKSLRALLGQKVFSNVKDESLQISFPQSITFFQMVLEEATMNVMRSSANMSQ